MKDLLQDCQKSAVAVARRMAYLAGFEPDAEIGSNTRRFLSRSTFLLIIVFACEVMWPDAPLNFDNLNPFSVQAAVGWSFIYFSVVVLIPVMVLSDRDFRLRPSRLFADILISGGYCIMAFGLLYRDVGFTDSIGGVDLHPRTDAYYFSAVTFSTLGFGDFRPVSASRGYAAIQGIWGNIHLGLLAGTVFFAMSEQTEPKSDEIDDDRHEK